MTDISDMFSSVRFEAPNRLILQTPSCGCCAEFYYSEHSYEPWSVSLDALEKHIAFQREQLNNLDGFVQQQRAAGKTMLSYGEDE
jgi:hypothetical protein